MTPPSAPREAAPLSQRLRAIANCVGFVNDAASAEAARMTPSDERSEESVRGVVAEMRATRDFWVKAASDWLNDVPGVDLPLCSSFIKDHLYQSGDEADDMTRIESALAREVAPSFDPTDSPAAVPPDALVLSEEERDVVDRLRVALSGAASYGCTVPAATLTDALSEIEVLRRTLKVADEAHGESAETRAFREAAMDVGAFMQRHGIEGFDMEVMKGGTEQGGVCLQQFVATYRALTAKDRT